MLPIVAFGVVIGMLTTAIVYAYKTRSDLTKKFKDIENEGIRTKNALKSLILETQKLRKTLKKQQTTSRPKSSQNRNVVGKETVKELIGELETEGLLPKNSKKDSKDVIIIQEIIHHSTSDDEASYEDMAVILDEARELVKSTGVASTPLLEKKLHISSDDAETILDRLEEEGIVGPPDGSSHRNVFIRE